MRLLLLTLNTAGKGGTYWRVLRLARALAQSGHEVAVVATARTARLRTRAFPDVQPRVTLVETPDLLPGSLRSGWDLWNVLHRIAWGVGQSPFDLIHGFEARPTVILPALFLKRVQRVPLVLDWADWFGRGGSVEERPNPLVRSGLRPIETFFEEHFRDHADGATVINSLLRQRALDLGIPAARIHFLPNGSDVEGLHPMPLADARRTVGLPEDALIVGYVGAMFRRDAALMVEAFERVHAAEPRARLLVIGCNIAVDRLVSSPGAVIALPPIGNERLGPYLSACDVCWLPLSDSGANRGRYPFKLGDYMATGRPVVATAVGDVTDMVTQGGFGLVAAPCADELSAQTLALLRDPGQRAVLGRRARTQAEEACTWNQIARDLEHFYRRVLERR